MIGGKRRRFSSVSKRSSLASMVDSLPNDVIVEVLARVAAAFSFSHLVNAKQSCKAFRVLAEDDRVYQRVSLDAFPLVPWRKSKETSSFLDKCKEKGNPEALFRQGVIEYFSHVETESGLQLLKRAADSGHIAATYTVGVILLSGDDEKKQEGMRIFCRGRKDKSQRDCRKKLKNMLASIWLNNKLLLDHIPEYYCEMRDQHKRKQGWCSDSDSDSDDEENVVDCEACECDREVIYLRKLLGNPHWP